MFVGTGTTAFLTGKTIGEHHEGPVILFLQRIKATLKESTGKGMKNSEVVCRGGKGILTCFSILFLITVGSSLYGQQQDFRSWWSIDFTKSLTDKLLAEVELEQRFQDNSLGYDRSLLTAGLEYALFNYFEIGGGYRYIVYRDDGMIASKYLIYGDVSYELSLSPLSFQLRERFQYGFQDFNTIENYSENNLTSRSRLGVGYDIVTYPILIYASYELFLGLDTSAGAHVRFHRYQSGAKYKLSMRSDLELGYMLNAGAKDSNSLNAHVLQVAFSYSL